MKIESSSRNELTGEYLEDYVFDREITKYDVRPIVEFMEKRGYTLSNLGISNDLDHEDRYFRVCKTSAELLFYFPDEGVYLDNFAFKCNNKERTFSLSFELGTKRADSCKRENYDMTPLLTDLEEYLTGLGERPETNRD